MGRTFIVFCMLFSVPASAAAAPHVGAPTTHGPDPAAVGRGPETAPYGSAAKRGARAPKLPTQWCGAALGRDDVEHETANGGFKYHAVYMLPADGADRFAQVAAGIQTDAFQASALLESHYGRAIRFDMGTSCGPQYLDVTVVRMRSTTRRLRRAARRRTGTYEAVSAALHAAGLDPISAGDSYDRAAGRTRNYVVWLDGPAPGGTCGQASIYDDPVRAGDNLNNYGGKVAIVFPNGDGFCSSNAVRHEIGHTLGALQPAAPHAFDGAHCDDALEDTMCYSHSPQVADGNRGQFFDWGNDDYWDPPTGRPLPWWTVNLNRFLCPDSTCNFAPVAAAAPTPRPVRRADGVREARPPRARVRMRARRRGTLWRLRLRLTGHGRAIVVVRCRKRRHGRVRTVYRRSTKLPRTIRRRVRCRAGRPRARLRRVRAG
jgi:hypothetical protein